MDLSRLLQRWSLPLALGIFSLILWQVANSADIAKVPVRSLENQSFVATPLLSARRIPETIQADIAEDFLSEDMGQLLNGSPENTCLIVQREDQPLSVQTNIDLPLVPASNQKILTTFSALHILGKDFRFTTTVTGDSEPVDGKISGNIYLVGGGDPYLSTAQWRGQFEQTEGRAFSRLEDLADQVVASGVSEISGSVVGDESLFDSVRVGPWAQRLVDQNQSGPLSALSVNEGYIEWTDERNLAQRVPAPAPSVHGASVFAELLRDRGVVIGGEATSGVSPAGLPVLTSLSSASLQEIVTHINSYSSNYGAEIVVKFLGSSTKGEGSTQAGAAVISETLASQGFNLSDVVILDGSGLSEENRVTCRLLLSAFTADSDVSSTDLSGGADSLLARSLSVGGVRGSLGERFLGSSAEGNVWAKTGTLQGVTALSGFVESSTEEDVDLIFVYIANESRITSQTKSLQDPFVVDLAEYPQGPRLLDLSPQSADLGIG